MTTSINRDTDIARRFHQATKYVAVVDENGEERFMMGVPPAVENPIWQEDWSVEPFPYKIYESLEPIPLPREFAASTLPALEAIACTGQEPAGERIPDLAAIARICLLSNGILKRGSHRPGGEIIEYRASGCTGARYHLELYLACGDLPDLAAGLYHYSAQDHSLRRLRKGDFRSTLVATTANEAAIAAAPVVLAMTSTFWRNAWRYKGRAYRHACWDAGTCFANILALAASAELPTRLVLGFEDRAVNDLFGVDGVREATLALCAIGRSAASPPPSPAVKPLELPTKPISAWEVDFPIIGEMHAGSELVDAAEVAAWRNPLTDREEPGTRDDLIPLLPLNTGDLPGIVVEDLIRSRRSTRNYDVETPITFEDFSTLIDRSSRGVDTDCVSPDRPPLHDHYLIVSGVEGLAQGVYQVHPKEGGLELKRPGDFRVNAQRIAVNQSYAFDAHVNSYYLARLDSVLKRYGNRGYRVAQLLSALYAGRLHLGTHALGLGAVGSTSFDDEVVEFFASDEADASYLFVTVFGKRRRRTP